MPRSALWTTWVPRSLGAKLVLLLSSVGLAGSVALAVFLSAVITPSFRRLENAAVAAQVERTQDALSRVLREAEVEVPARSGRASFVWTGRTLATVVVVRRTGEPRRIVRPVATARLTRALGRPVRIQPASQRSVFIDRGRDELTIGVPVAAGGAQGVAVLFELPRDLSILGFRVLVLAIGGVVLLLVVVLVALRASISGLVLRPLRGVEQHMTRVRESGMALPLTVPERQDEIGSLFTGCNAMLRQLKDLREQVEVQSFKLGQHESAVAMMHNVRNALNPISTILSHELASTPAADRVLIERAAAELSSDDIPPARRQKLAAFVAAGLKAHTSEQQARAASFAVGRAALNQVLEIVGGQRRSAHEPPPLTTVDLTEVVAQNAAIARFAVGTSIAFVFPSRPHLARANRVILSQVIGNLLTNAAEAIAARGEQGGAITASITERGATVELLVRDNGEGFDPAQAPALFERSYSSRAHKSGGLGLHWCANAVAAMGGTLRLESAGVGTGACAVLVLPAARHEALAA